MLSRGQKILSLAQNVGLNQDQKDRNKSKPPEYTCMPLKPGNQDPKDRKKVNKSIPDHTCTPLKLGKFTCRRKGRVQLNFNLLDVGKTFLWILIL